ncbi:MAG: HD domain-containing protein [Nanoarchaeota archaeon]
MRINDRIYGVEEINNKVIIDLIKSASIRRLKDISQLGMPDEYSRVKGFSRYEHSVGVMILIKRIGGGLEEQIAGLLHDASHTPFSHVIDWVLGDPTKEDYQDKIHEEFLKNSDLPSILKKYDLDIKNISNYKKFGLLEKEAPSLCADRIDYSLRQMKNKKNDKLVDKVVKNISVRENQIVFKDKETAKSFGEEYMNLQVKQWAGDEMRGRYYILSEILKKAFEKNLINLGDLKKTEKPILKILKESEDEFILDKLDLLRKGFKVIPDENGIELKKKFRYLDPEVLVNGSCFSLSKLSKEYFELIESEKERSRELNKIKIISN